MNKKLLIIAFSVLLFFAFIALILIPIGKKPPHKPIPAVKGRIAVVIDDWGYNLANLKIAEEIKYPLTCAVLPNLKNSGLVARRLNSLGFEIILHLPMQPKEKYRLEKETITASMDRAQIRAIINKDLASVLFARGISNHMGSYITEDTRVSSLIISEVKKRNLYFLDSFVTAKSVCSVLAKRMRVRFAKRGIFLDNRDDPEYIKGQIIKLKELSARKGYAVGIGHDRRNTLLVLKKMIPELEKSGYKFIFVSEIAK